MLVLIEINFSMHQLMAFSILYVVRERGEKEEKANDINVAGQRRINRRSRIMVTRTKVGGAQKR